MVPGTRELIVPPYIIVYRVISHNLETINILHGARQR